MVTLLPERVSNIHANIWRGNFPLTLGGVSDHLYNVDFVQLKKLLSVRPEQDLIEVCLTDNTGEVDYLEVLERTYECQFTRSAPPFNDPQWNPLQCYRKLDESEKHWVIWWPIEGGTTPDVTGPGVGYNFSGLIDYLSKFIRHAATEAVVYVHCLNGTDRTGAVAASLAFKFKGITVDQAIAEASDTRAGTMSQPYLELVRHYCK